MQTVAVLCKAACAGHALVMWFVGLQTIKDHCRVSRFFGGGGFPGFGGFGGMGDEEEQTPKGHDVHVELEVTLKDLYLGHQYKAGTSQ